MKIKGHLIGVAFLSENTTYIILPQDIEVPFCIPLADKFGVFEKPKGTIGFPHAEFMLKSYEKGYHYQLTRIEDEKRFPLLSLRASLEPQSEELEGMSSVPRYFYQKPLGYYEIDLKVSE